MSDFEFTVPTERPVADVKATIEAEIASRLPGGRIQRFWEGDVYRLVGMGADGRIEVRPGEISARATLKAPISFMRAKVEQGLRETVEKAAAGTPGSPAAAAREEKASPAPAPTDQVVPPAEIDELRERVSGVVLPGAQAHDEFLTNFGHLHHWRPRVVVKPVVLADCTPLMFATVTLVTSGTCTPVWV